jgi:hypothetical protein
MVFISFARAKNANDTAALLKSFFREQNRLFLRHDTENVCWVSFE